MHWGQARSIVVTYTRLPEQALALQAANKGYLLVDDLDRARKDLEFFKQSVPADVLEEAALCYHQWGKNALPGVGLNGQELRELCRLSSLRPGRIPGFYKFVEILERAAGKDDGASTDSVGSSIQGLLGPDRYAAYKRDQDGAFRKMLSLAQASSLSYATTAQTYDQASSARQAHAPAPK
jgi:hypothetical protein